MTMDRLVEIIGPAPSELPPNTFLGILAKERDRVRRAMDDYLNNLQPTKKKAKKKRAAPKKVAARKALAKDLKKHDLTPEQVQALLIQLKEKQNATN